MSEQKTKLVKRFCFGVPNVDRFVILSSEKVGCDGYGIGDTLRRWGNGKAVFPATPHDIPMVTVLTWRSRSND